MSRTSPARPISFPVRLVVVFGLLLAAGVALAGRAVQLQLLQHRFLAGEGAARFTRVAAISAHRGTITDRYGEPLAVSTPVDSVWANPQELAANTEQLQLLARTMHADPHELLRRVSTGLDRAFLYLWRGLQPAEARKVRELNISGVNLSREYRRYYPAGEVTGHLLGFTDVDDTGQEGVELAFDHWLGGEDGAKRVIQDSDGNKVEDVESIRAVRPGRELPLSIDLRLQYLAYRELKAAIRDNRANSGSAVIIDIRTGEVLAMVNQPAYNPNDRRQLNAAAYRNRAATDLFEPGSSIKPFFVAAGLASGRFQADSIIDTSPGYVQVGTSIIHDEHNLGPIPLSTVLAKSSNVGMARLALALEPRQIWSTLNGLGFGQVTASGFPGESAGQLTNYSHWRSVLITTMSHGYGLSVTPLQLAQGYATLGAFGLRRPVSLVRVDAPVPGERVLDRGVSFALLHLLEAVITPDGTGNLARIPGYRVAGKTGTAWKAEGGGYSQNRYVAVFGGVAPVSNPRLAAVVVIDEPSTGKYHGGDVAAPVFSAILGGALRLMGIPPDDLASATGGGSPDGPAALPPAQVALR
ncbi:MAG TPA: penicillin-binding transpeptidase domain-containing protein [Steroidobacteraceae bacterium]|nr:penicillin-binding transpeptidase domain-containing protein [Steroidobacteraceae bacterium]